MELNIQSDEEKLLETALSGNIFEVISRMIVNHHNELAKTVALYTLLKIMEKEIGLRKMFESHDQTRCIFGALRTMILEVVNNSDQPNYKICKHTVKIYKILFDYRKNVEYPVLKEIPIEINSEHIKDILSKDNQGLAIWQKLVEEVRHQRKENSKHIYHASLQALKDSSNQK
ncbi:hypothetical protein RF11_06832 [Thelohanellus kitauei]|uniref:CCR4-NOT transcription complex subunit 9 n=1 Tax=Thelohanellus kitauei TaxID=669202 RepID=A0A0C2ISG5_THEKT|nr:hypothetical protein RF11_06832 [Thelohanellus kitauei]